MDERKTVSRLKRGDSMALALVIEQYSAYLYTIVSAIMGSRLPAEDVEEIVSESFIALWYNRQKIQAGKLRPYLAAIARSKAVSRLRSLHLHELLEDDVLICSCPSPEYELLCAELADIARAAVDSLPEPDREIFKRHYFLYEKTESIAKALGMNSATVRTKLARGRRQLKKHLTERGYDCENLLD